MSDFDKWKTKNHAVYSAYGETYFLGAERAWNHQQQKIDEIYELKQKMVERVIELSAENEKLQNRLLRLK